MTDPTRFEGVRAEALRLREENVYASMGTPWLAFPLERAFAMQGTDNFLANLAGEPEFAEALLWKTQSLCKALMDGFLRECGDLLDMVKIGDDLGSQVGLLDVAGDVPPDAQAHPRGPDRLHPRSAPAADRVPHRRRRVRPAATTSSRSGWTSSTPSRRRPAA